MKKNGRPFIHLETELAIIESLFNGMTSLATARMFKVHRNTVLNVKKRALIEYKRRRPPPPQDADK